MKFRAVGIVSVMMCTASAALAEPLEKEIERLLETHPQIRAAQSNLAASESGIDAAFADFLPKISFSGQYGYDYIDSPGRRSAEPDGTEISAVPRKVGFSMTQTVFNGFANQANNETAQLSRDAADISLNAVSQNVAMSGVVAYLQLLRDIMLLELSRASESNVQRQLELEDERVRRGSGITVDVLQAKSRLQSAKERRVSLEGELENSRSRFEQVFGAMPDIASMVMPTPPLDILPTELDEAISVAVARNPSLAQTTVNVEIARTQQDTAAAAYYPTVDLVTEWNFEDDFNGTLGTRRDAKASLQLNWQFFDGFATDANVNSAVKRFHASVDEEAFARRSVVEGVRLAWQGLQTARKRVGLLQNAVNISSEVWDSRKRLREAGNETVINVLDAESEVFSVRINLVTAQHDARVAVYQLLLAIGDLVPSNLNTARN